MRILLVPWTSCQNFFVNVYELDEKGEPKQDSFHPLFQFRRQNSQRIVFALLTKNAKKVGLTEYNPDRSMRMAVKLEISSDVVEILKIINRHQRAMAKMSQKEIASITNNPTLEKVHSALAIKTLIKG
jgi:hypothetical protein